MGRSERKIVVPTILILSAEDQVRVENGDFDDAQNPEYERIKDLRKAELYVDAVSQGEDGARIEDIQASSDANGDNPIVTFTRSGEHMVIECEDDDDQDVVVAGLERAQSSPGATAEIVKEVDDDDDDIPDTIPDNIGF